MATNMNAQMELIIRSGNFNLSDTLEKIDIFFANDQLTKDQREALIDAAREKATPDAAYADILTRVTDLELMYRALKDEFKAFKAEFDGEGGSDTGAETEEDIPEYTQPTGAHNAYNTGDKVIYEGKIYESVIDGNVWSPSAYPAGWKYIEDVPVVEDEEDNTEEVDA